MAHIESPLIVGIGEALFDCLPDSERLGGAPVNFALHAHRLLQAIGGSGHVVSCVGHDDRGYHLVEQLEDRGLSTEYLQRCPDLPTGTVQVTLDTEGQPTYEITRNVAWDRLELSSQSRQLAQRCHAVSFGTLAQRSCCSQQSIFEFLSLTSPTTLRVLDLNLRQQFFTAETILNSLKLANVVKLNEEELQITHQLLNLGNNGQSFADQARSLCTKFDLKLLALTRGQRGTQLFNQARKIAGKPCSYPAADNADSVGAGDGCCAAITCGLLLNWPLEQIVELANHVGAFITSQPGATPQLPTSLLPTASS